MMSDARPEKPCEHETVEDGLKYAALAPHEGDYNDDVKDAVCELFDLVRILCSSITIPQGLQDQEAYAAQTYRQFRRIRKAMTRLEEPLFKQTRGMLRDALGRMG